MKNLIIALLASCIVFIAIYAALAKRTASNHPGTSNSRSEEKIKTNLRWDQLRLYDYPIYNLLVKARSAGSGISEYKQWEMAKREGKPFVDPQRQKNLKELLLRYPDTEYADDAAMLLARSKFFYDDDARGAIKDLYEVISMYPNGTWIAEDALFLEYAMLNNVTKDGKTRTGGWFGPTLSLQKIQKLPKGPLRDNQIESWTRTQEFMTYFKHLDKHPNLTSEEARYWIAKIIRYAGLTDRYDEAIDNLQKVVNAHKIDKRAEIDLDESNKQFGRLILDKFPRTERKCHAELLDYYIQKQDYSKAIRIAEEYLSLHKDHKTSYEVHRKAGHAYEALGKWSKAALHYKEFLTSISIGNAFAAKYIKKFNEMRNKAENDSQSSNDAKEKGWKLAWRGKSLVKSDGPLYSIQVRSITEAKDAVKLNVGAILHISKKMPSRFRVVAVKNNGEIVLCDSKITIQGHGDLKAYVLDAAIKGIKLKDIKEFQLQFKYRFKINYFSDKNSTDKDGWTTKWHGKNMVIADMPDGSVGVGNIKEKNGQLTISINDTYYDGTECRIIAVDNKGNIHKPKQSCRIENGRITEAAFADVKLKDVKEFKFQIRPQGVSIDLSPKWREFESGQTVQLYAVVANESDKELLITEGEYKFRLIVDGKEYIWNPIAKEVRPGYMRLKKDEVHEVLLTIDKGEWRSVKGGGRKYLVLVPGRHSVRVVAIPHPQSEFKEKIYSNRVEFSIKTPKPSTTSNIPVGPREHTRRKVDMKKVFESGLKKYGIDDFSLNSLTGLLENKNSTVRFYAVSLLGERKELSAVAQMEKRLQDISFPVRFATAQALLKMDNRKGVAVMKHYADVASIEAEAGNIESLVNHLDALKFLADAGEVSAVGHLRKLLKHSGSDKGWIRLKAVRSLGKLQSKDSTVTKDIESMLSDKDPLVRKTAAEILKKRLSSN